uniref:Uncharacterized protein n=1 Tax=Phytophthora ramorum TaxID=164328 RepID=H3GGH7_PHYRM
MRQRASTKTQRRLKQQQLRDPYALTGDVNSEAPTFRVGGLVTAVGALQLVAALAFSGFVFGGALLFCAALSAVLGLALLHHSDAKGSRQGLGLMQAISQLLALRRSALDYSLTLSIAQSEGYRTQKQLQIAVVPSSPTPQKVVATMALTQEEPVHKKKMTGLKALPTISVEATGELPVEKPRANSEPKQVLRTRPLLPLKPKVQVAAPEEKKKKKTQVKTTAVKQETKAPQVQLKAQPKLQQQKKPEPKLTQVAAKKEVQVPTVLHKNEPAVVIPAVLPKAELVAEQPKPKPVATVPATVVVEPFVSEADVPVIAPMPVFPERKSLVEVARGEPAMEQELVVTRKVLLYLSPENESVMDVEDQQMEQEHELELELEHHESENFDLSTEAFPPLSPPMAPRAAMPAPPSNAMEPNFLMDIELEPISKPGNKLISFGSLRLKPVGNAELRTMLDELDVMRLELDAAMARCSSLLSGKEEKVLAPSSPELEPEEEPIFCF